MSIEVQGRITRVDRRARIAGAALLLTNGALFANLIPRFPEIKAAIDIENALYGLAVWRWRPSPLVRSSPVWPRRCWSAGSCPPA